VGEFDFVVWECALVDWYDCCVVGWCCDCQVVCVGVERVQCGWL